MIGSAAAMLSNLQTPMKEGTLTYKEAKQVISEAKALALIVYLVCENHAKLSLQLGQKNRELCSRSSAASAPRARKHLCHPAGLQGLWLLGNTCPARTQTGLLSHICVLQENVSALNHISVRSAALYVCWLTHLVNDER